MPHPNIDHARAVANSAIRFIRYLERRNQSHQHKWLCRIGLASGSVVGSAVAPVIKVCANPDTYRKMPDDMDVDAGRILSGNVIALEPGVLDHEGWTEKPFVYARFGDDVSVIDDREKFANAERFPDAEEIVVDSMTCNRNPTVCATWAR